MQIEIFERISLTHLILYCFIKGDQERAFEAVLCLNELSYALGELKDYVLGIVKQFPFKLDKCQSNSNITRHKQSFSVDTYEALVYTSQERMFEKFMKILARYLS